MMQSTIHRDNSTKVQVQERKTEMLLIRTTAESLTCDEERGGGKWETNKETKTRGMGIAGARKSTLQNKTENKVKCKKR